MTAVRFGTVAASYTVVSPMTIVATVPLTPSLQQGQTVEITVVNGTTERSIGDPSTAARWIWDPRPTISSMSATTGLEGSTITLTGTGFTDATAVRWDSIDARAFTVVGDTTITATVPVSPVGGNSVASVTVTARGYSSLEPVLPNANKRSWAPIAAISSVTTPLPAGSTATVTGRNFTNVREVTVNGLSVTPTVVSSTKLTFTVPPRPGKSPEYNTNKPVVLVNGSGANSTNDSATANLFTWS